MSGALSTNLRLIQSLAFGQRGCTTCFRFSFRSNRFLSSNFYANQLAPSQILSQRQKWSLFFRNSNLQASEEESHLKNIHEKYEQEKQTKRKRWDKYRKISLLVTVGGTAFWVVYFAETCGKPEIDSITGVVFEDEFSGQNFEKLRRAWFRMRQDVTTEFAEPSRKKLLPEPMKPPYIQPKYTVLLELKDVLVHPEWSFETGWRFKKRPGIDFLLDTIAMPKYEVVIFTSEPANMAFPIAESLNSKGSIMYTLFRDSTHYKNNVYMKDLSRINRDLSKVILIDTEKAKVSPNCENALVIPPWDGNMADRSLYDLAMFLKTIESTHCSDVRTFLSAYANEIDPLSTFRERQLMLQEQEKSSHKTHSRSRVKSLTKDFFRR